MAVDRMRIITRKAMIYDLQLIIQDTPGLDADTVKTIFKIMDDYIVREAAEDEAE